MAVVFGPLVGSSVSEHRYGLSHAAYIVGMGVCAAFVGGAHSFLLPLLCPFVLGFFSRLRPTIAATYATVSFGLALVPVLVSDWVGFRHAPWLLGSCALGVFTIVLIAAPMAAGEIHHRAEATIDQLTGLLNRRGLEDRLTEIVQQALVIGADTPIAVVAGDLDHFKRVNDTYGHPRGDAVLREVAYIMRKSVRRFELIYRMGGEEFLIVVPGHDVESAAGLAEVIRDAIEAGRPGGVDLTISMGVALCTASDFHAGTLLEAADAAVYAAKRSGRNRVVLASEVTPARTPTAGGSSSDYSI